jgi:hypothetical protein
MEAEKSQNLLFANWRTKKIGYITSFQSQRPENLLMGV